MMKAICDHPTVRNLERTGTPDGRAEKFPICPICGEETDTYYKDIIGEIVGCGECIKRTDAWDEQEDM